MKTCKKSINVCAVIVTYGSRFFLLESVIDALLKQRVCRIFIVDNNVEKNDRNLLLKKKAENKDIIKIISRDENTGSAGGYKSGIKKAVEDSSCKFIWLLDDDNLPEKDALLKLIAYWKTVKDQEKNKKIALLANRLDQPIYEEAIKNGDPDLFLTRSNNFLGFHFVDTFRVISKIFFNKKKKINRNCQNNEILKVAPYGGMFFHKYLIKTIGLPNENYFVYADDFDFSHRIIKKSGKIIFVSNALIHDNDESWGAKEIKNPIKRLLKGDDFKVYYYIRNRTFFEIKNLRTNKFIYNVNTFIILSLFYLYSFFDKTHNLKIIKRAIRDGSAGKLGKNDLFN
jgi:GT2 family glycosyltransferase